MPWLASHRHSLEAGQGLEAELGLEAAGSPPHDSSLEVWTGGANQPGQASWELAESEASLPERVCLVHRMLTMALGAASES